MNSTITGSWTMACTTSRLQITPSNKTMHMKRHRVLKSFRNCRKKWETNMADSYQKQATQGTPTIRSVERLMLVHSSHRNKMSISFINNLKLSVSTCSSLLTSPLSVDQVKIDKIISFGYPEEYVLSSMLDMLPNYCTAAYYLLEMDQNYCWNIHSPI